MLEPLIVIGVIFLLLAAFIVRIQFKAKECPRHSKTAGILAWVAVLVCLLLGITLMSCGIR